MLNPSVMRNVASPGRLLALAAQEGVPDGEIRMQPLAKQLCVLVMATGEDVSEEALEKVVSGGGNSTVLCSKHNHIFCLVFRDRGQCS